MCHMSLLQIKMWMTIGNGDKWPTKAIFEMLVMINNKKQKKNIFHRPAHTYHGLKYLPLIVCFASINEIACYKEGTLQCRYPNPRWISIMAANCKQNIVCVTSSITLKKKCININVIKSTVFIVGVFCITKKMLIMKIYDTWTKDHL